MVPLGGFCGVEGHWILWVVLVVTKEIVVGVKEILGFLAPTGDSGAKYLTAFSTIIKTQTDGISFERSLFIPPVELYRVAETISRSTEVVSGGSW